MVVLSIRWGDGGWGGVCLCSKYSMCKKRSMVLVNEPPPVKVGWWLKVEIFVSVVLYTTQHST